MELSNKNKAIIEAYERGYRVTEDGQFIGFRGEIREDYYIPGKYPEFKLKKAKQRIKTTTIRIHRFAAYCFYGDKIFEPGIIVRHLNDDKLDYSKANIALGTYQDNADDRKRNKKTV